MWLVLAAVRAKSLSPALGSGMGCCPDLHYHSRCDQDAGDAPASAVGVGVMSGAVVCACCSPSVPDDHFSCIGWCRHFLRGGELESRGDRQHESCTVPGSSDLGSVLVAITPWPGSCCCGLSAAVPKRCILWDDEHGDTPSRAAAAAAATCQAPRLFLLVARSAIALQC